jgi:hypothetical protein
LKRCGTENGVKNLFGQRGLIGVRLIDCLLDESRDQHAATVRAATRVVHRRGGLDE